MGETPNATVVPLDPAAAELLAKLRPAGVPGLHAMPLAKARAYAAALPSIVGAGPGVGRVSDVLVAGRVPVRIYEHPRDEGDATVVYLHGGGWVMGGIANDDALSRALVAACGCRVLSVGYRLAPEHRFPAALDDVLEVLAWASPSRLAVVGDSAGANLAAAAALTTRETREAPRAQVLVCPLLDDATTASRIDPGQPGLITSTDLAWFWDQYVPDPAARSDPRAAPLRCDDLTGAAPALIVTAGHDPLRDDGAQYAERLAVAGVPVRHEHRADLMHGFLPLAALLPASAAVVEVIGDFLMQVLGT